MQTRHRIIVLILLVLALPAAPAYAGGVVSVCDESHLLTALSGGGAVTFTCSGYIGLTNTITIAANTTIDASGQSVTISGNSEARVFVVKSGVSLTLSHLTVSWGKDTSGWIGGGAVYSDGGHVIITNSMITDNEAAFAGGGVMIYNGTLTVDASTFSSDSASIGGGIAAYAATVTVSNSTFSSNFATRSNVTDGSGAGIFAEVSQVTVSNSTFKTNDADGSGGAIASDESRVTIINCTFYRNSATNGNALERSGSGWMTLKNTIVADPLYGANCSGTMTDGGNNLSYPDTSCPGINLNPRLQNLNNNGGPTFTMLLGPGSPAIDAANDATCAAPPINNLDQRGVKRPRGAHCDIGAVEQMSFSAPHPRAIDIDIKPDSSSNRINCRNENQVIAVAILSTPDFDAMSVDPATVSFEGATEIHVNKETGESVLHTKDVDGDGNMDLVFHFRLGSTSLTCGSTEGTLVGETFEGQGITGTDSVRMVDEARFICRPHSQSW